jgi:hypothetical protein
MFRRKRKSVREKAFRASELALQLAQDKRFREHAQSAFDHGRAVWHQSRRGRGLMGERQDGSRPIKTCRPNCERGATISSRRPNASTPSSAATGCGGSSSWLGSSRLLLCPKFGSASPR